MRHTQTIGIGKVEDVILDNEPRAQLPAVIDYGEYEGAGAENVTQDDYVIPLIRILHYQCPEILRPAQGGIEGAAPGMLLNTATREVYDVEESGITMIPVDYKRDYVEWVPRKNPATGEQQPGGFVGRRKVDDPLVTELKASHGDFRSLPTEEGHELVETRYLYALFEHDGGRLEQVVVPFSSTRIQAVKQFWTKYLNIRYPNSKGVMIRPPLWAHRWTLKTFPFTNKVGQNFFLFTLGLKEQGDPIRSRMRLDDQTYVAGREFYEMIQSGLARAAEPEADKDAEDIPF